MNEKQQLSMIEDLENFAFEIARICREGFSINAQDMTLIQMCYHHLDRISEQMLEDEESWHNIRQTEEDENRRLNADAMASIRSALR
jgi:hypothetical protein